MPPFDAKLLAYLQEILTPERMVTFDQVLAKRTRRLSVVVEDIYQPHNASAVLRSCDCFGVQNVHILEYQNEYELNPNVSLGSSKWLTLHHHRESDGIDPITECFDQLRASGHRILATTPHTDDTTLEDVDVSQPIALVFGNEGRGISDRVKAEADGFVKIPMHGFTESFNISVSAALCLYTLTQKIRQGAEPWQLSAEEQDILRLDWTRKTIKRVEEIEKRFYETHGGKD